MCSSLQRTEGNLHEDVGAHVGAHNKYNSKKNIDYSFVIVCLSMFLSFFADNDSMHLQAERDSLAGIVKDEAAHAVGLNKKV